MHENTRLRLNQFPDLCSLYFWFWIPVDICMTSTARKINIVLVAGRVWWHAPHSVINSIHVHPARHYTWCLHVQEAAGRMSGILPAHSCSTECMLVACAHAHSRALWPHSLQIKLKFYKANQPFCERVKREVIVEICRRSEQTVDNLDINIRMLSLPLSQAHTHTLITSST